MKSRPLEDPDTSFFVALETRVWQALAGGDRDADVSLLDPEFIGVYATGFANREDHAAQLSNGPAIGGFSINEPRLVRLAPEVALLSYVATFTRLGGPVPNGSQTIYVSSIWRQHGGSWLNVFSQDTSAKEAATGDPSASPESVVQRQLEAYNARDLKRFLAEYSDDVLVYRPPAAEPVMVGKEALGSFYATQRFTHANLHAELVNRIVLGSKVIDHERISGVHEHDFEVAVVYEVTNGVIQTMWSHAKD